MKSTAELSKAIPTWLIKASLFPKICLKKALAPFVKWGTEFLIKEKDLYNPSEVTNVRALAERVKPGDVLLVCGNARISHVVKVLTVSQWSHVMLYVGDRKDLLSEKEIEEWSKKYGYAALEHLVVDSDPVRVIHLKPLEEYLGLMIRHCRAEALSKEDNEKVVNHALSQLGREYDVRHIFRLMFFFGFPWEILPEALRRFVTDFTLSDSDRICSRVLSEAFHSVGYPIRPVELIRSKGAFQDRALGMALGLKQRGKTAARLLAGGRVRKAFNRISDNRYTISLRGTRHITPADYDLSRFFTIIKDPGDLNIDYKHSRVICRWEPPS